jgi:hypothetical protein
MGKIAKDRAMLGLTVPIPLRDEIDRRAAVLNLSRSAYSALILDDWWRRKCPPVSEPDRFMQLAKSASIEQK